MLIILFLSYLARTGKLKRQLSLIKSLPGKINGKLIRSKMAILACLLAFGQ